MMIKKLPLCLSVAAMILCSCGSDEEEWKPNGGGNTPPPSDNTIVWHERAKEVYDVINRHYAITTGQYAGLYNENYPKDGQECSYLWPYDGFVSGVASLYALGYDIDYKSAVDKFNVYWRDSSPVADVGGYGSYTNGTVGSGDRFFDDNSIVGLDLVEAYRLTKDEKYIAQAGKVVKFLLSGEDDVFGGGLWWNESLKNVQGRDDSNKPACSNSFATLFLLSYYEICPESERTEVLDFAKRLYTWLTENLRDPSDGVYWNDMEAGNGSINTTKWTYNSGAMISNGVRLYKITGESRYLDDAKKTAAGSFSYFVKPIPTAGIALGYPRNDSWFTTKLVKAYIDIEPYYKTATSYIKTFVDYADFAWNHARQKNGLFYEDWSGTPNPDRDKSLLMQDAVLESYGAIALYKGEKLDK